MDVSYQVHRVDLDAGEHSDAKEVNDLVNALVDKDGNALQEGLEALMAIGPDMAGNDRFLHLYKVFTAVLDNQLQARFIEQDEVKPGIGATSN